MNNTTNAKIKKVVKILLAIFVSFFLISNVAATIIIHSIFARCEYTPENDPVYTLEDNNSYPREEIYFASESNTLFGYLYRAKSPKGNLILVHGMNSYGDHYLNITKYFVDHNWNVLSYDMTGTGKSEGSYTKGLVQMKIDLNSAIRYLEGDSSVNSLPIALWGHSMGGYAVIAATENAPEVSGVVSVSAFNRPNQIMTEHANEYVGVLSYISYPFLWLNNYFVFGNDANVVASEILQNTSVPMMIIHGNDDAKVPMEYSVYSQRNSINNPEVTFILSTEKSHNNHSNFWLSENAQNPNTSNPFELDMEAMKVMEEYLSKAVLSVSQSGSDGTSGLY